MVCELRKSSKDVFAFASFFRNVGVVISVGMIFSTIFASYQIFNAHVFPKLVCTGGGEFRLQNFFETVTTFFISSVAIFRTFETFKEILNFRNQPKKQAWLSLLFTCP